MALANFRRKKQREKVISFQGKILEDYRREYDLSMEELANLLGVSLSCVWCWETGKTQPRKRGLDKLKELIGAPDETISTTRG